MKIEKCITVEADVEVDIAAEDISACLAEATGSKDPEDKFWVGRTLTNAVLCLEAIPDEYIKGADHRLAAAVLGRLAKQVERWHAASHEPRATAVDSVASVSSVADSQS